MDNAPMLHQEHSNDVMLGGDRKIELCPTCGERMLRDFFGNVICPKVLANDDLLATLRHDPKCPNCRATEYLNAELVTDHHGIILRILNVYCDNCERYIWIGDLTFEDYDATAYLLPDGKLEPSS